MYGHTPERYLEKLFHTTLIKPHKCNKPTTPMLMIATQCIICEHGLMDVLIFFLSCLYITIFKRFPICIIYSISLGSSRLKLNYQCSCYTVWVCLHIHAGISLWKYKTHFEICIALHVWRRNFLMNHRHVSCKCCQYSL